MRLAPGPTPSHPIPPANPPPRTEDDTPVIAPHREPMDDPPGPGPSAPSREPPERVPPARVVVA